MVIRSLLILIFVYFLEVQWAFSEVSIYTTQHRINLDVSTGKPVCEYTIPAWLFLDQERTDRLLDMFRCALHLKLQGEINESDVELFKAVLTAFSEDIRWIKSRHKDYIVIPPDIILDSNGGSVSAALEMGRFIRSPALSHMGLATTVLLMDECLSSCVFIYAAGYVRSPYGDIGIHRPYLKPEEYKAMGYSKVSDVYIRLNDDLKKYFRSLFVDDELVDDMYAVPSSEIKLLSERELINYRMKGKNLVVEERGIARVRQLCGDAGMQHHKRGLKQINECLSHFRAPNGKLTSNDYAYCYDKIESQNLGFKTCMSQLNDNE